MEHCPQACQRDADPASGALADFGHCSAQQRLTQVNAEAAVQTIQNCSPRDTKPKARLSQDPPCST
jgi:hypothetical protein